MSSDESADDRADLDAAANAAADADEVWTLRLYVAGNSPKSVAAYENLKQVCETYLSARYEIEVVDLIEHPRLARSDEILAIPTLVRRVPSPTRKVIGDLSDTDRVLSGLQVQPKPC